MPRKKHLYERVALHEASDIVEEERLSRTIRKPYLWPVITYLNLGLFAISMGVLWFSRDKLTGHNNAVNDLLALTSTPSPIFHKVRIGLGEKRMNATLLPTPHDEVYRGLPSAEVDLAWDRIANTQPIALTKEEMATAGLDPSTIVKYPESFGLGEAYAARIDVFHQIHCLDALRKQAYWEDYKLDGWTSLNTSSKLHQTHLSHCLYYLLQSITCHASVDIYPHIWTDTLRQPYPDFNTVKTCRNFDAILAWQEAHGIDETDFYALRRPASYGPPAYMSDEFKDVWRTTPWYNEEADEHHGQQIG
ncbi:hypothetical protein CLAFUW4_12641 [Fulvia fulva]|uniref:Tat pathway signal sequence n=1 Tax=Passalora fulva TaxID=5499 RepID=A0A9Q8PDV7_PASFU|nr:uncharacterized protein CLAFUR5_11664 [Fulvia fulva]UJO20673.1 hypothetical protein CLAFUR5_11664 [Fulvia fulva]WPV18344.1 hypothetical protein CLAFUW4_12641 [Fulvia fulva]WPV33264.1 hypothetical protein CLAFUW7_12648 [Fulvia fulva]